MLAATMIAAENRKGPPKASRTLVRVTAGEQDPPLERGAFAAKVNANPAKVLRVQGPEDDLVVLLVLDLSGDPALVDAARDALTQKIGELAKNHWVGVIRAQDGLKALVDPTGEREQVLTAIRDYAATGKAGLLDTIEPVAALGQRLMQRSGLRVAVLYVTDSNITNYREDYTNPVINSSDSRDLSRKFPDQLIREKIQKISDQLAKFETPIFVLQLSYFADPINEAYQRGLLQLATESGGLGSFCRSRGEIPTAVDQVLHAAAHHWSVSVELKKTRQRAVTVNLHNGEREILSRTRFALGN